MIISTKGQVTIPQHIREELGLLPNTEVRFEIDGNAVRLLKVEDSRRVTVRSRLIRGLRSRATVSMSTDEIMALTREVEDTP